MVRSMVSVREELLSPIWKNSQRKPMIWCEKAGNLVHGKIWPLFAVTNFRLQLVCSAMPGMSNPKKRKQSAVSSKKKVRNHSPFTSYGDLMC